MKNKHGFTLIELLAVIVVLAIIALIATPIVMNIINSSKDSANKVSASNFASEANKYAVEQKINGMTASGNIFDEVSKRMDGKKPETGVVYSDDNGNIALALVFDNRCYTKEYNSNEIKTADINECHAPVDFLALGNTDNDTEATFFNGPIKKSSVEKIVFVDNTNVPTDAIGNWNASASGEGKVVAWYKDEDNNNLYEVYIGGEGGVKANPNSSKLFYVFSNLTSIDLRYLDTSSVTNMSSMFNNCSSLTTLDVSNFNTSKVTDMSYMFASCSATELDLSNFDTSNNTSMYYMFYRSNATTIDVSNFDTGKVKNMQGMFQWSRVTTIDVSNWDTSKVSNMQVMFMGVQAKELDVSNWDTSNVTDMWGMFWDARTETIDVSNFNTGKVKDMSHLFLNSNIATIDVSNWDTSNVTNMAGMFGGTRATILDVSNFDTSKVTNMFNMFARTRATTIYASDKFTTDNVTESTDMFNNATNLIGGNGTKYDSSHRDKEYARIDTTENPGYFTLKEN